MSKYSNALSGKDKNFLKAQFGDTYEYIKKESDVLDVGCSTGYFGKLLKIDKKCKVYGIDIDKKDLAVASKVLDKTLYVDLEMPYLPSELLINKFDVIFFGDVIEHVLSPKDILKKFRNLLKKDGIIIISVPNIAHLSIRLELLAGNFDYEPLGILDETHTKYFTYKSITQLIKESGYKVCAVDYSVAEVPKKTIQYFLDKVGLVANSKFDKIVEQPDSLAYQFKIVARPSAKPLVKKLPSLKTKPLAHKHQEELKVLNNKQIQIEKQKNEIKNLVNELEGMKKSTSWRVTKPLRKAKKVIKRKG